MLFCHIVGDVKNVAFLFDEFIFDWVLGVTFAMFRAVNYDIACATTATRVVLAIFFFASDFHAHIICKFQKNILQFYHESLFVKRFAE